MARHPTYALLLVTSLLLSTAASSEGNQTYEFPGPQCLNGEPVSGSNLVCKFLWKANGILTYGLYFDRQNKPLLEFSRSARVLVGSLSYRLAINSYEDSNYTNCYVFWDARSRVGRVSVADAWSKALNESSTARALAVADHVYYVCSKWSGDTVDVTVKWDWHAKGYRTMTAKLLPTGDLVDLALPKGVKGLR